MSENLVYGADILAYGAIGDGVTDCSEALSKAIENGESLISFPFGTYLFTKPIVLNSNTKLHFHPSSCIKFAPSKKEEKSFISAKNASGIEICCGIFDIEDGIHCDVFSFFHCENIRISACSINAPTSIGSIRFNNCSFATVSNVTFNGMSDAVVLTGECNRVTVKNCKVKSCINFLQFGTNNEDCNIDTLDTRDISVLYCDSFVEFLRGKAEGVSIENINARFSFAFVKLFENFDLQEASLENLDIYIVDRGANEGKTKAYFSLASCPDSFEIRNFKRKSDFESTPLVPTFIINNTDVYKAKIIIDGISLDNVIAARGKSKTVSMTTAKLTNPCNKFIYTLEIGVAKADTFTIPYGDFDYLCLDRY